MGDLEEEIKKHWFNREEIMLKEYADVLRKSTEDLEKLDKETSYFPIVEMRESGIPGRWGEESFCREWSISPRKWEDQNVEEMKKKMQEYQKLVAKYSTRIIELQEIIARQNESSR